MLIILHVYRRSHHRPMHPGPVPVPAVSLAMPRHAVPRCDRYMMFDPTEEIRPYRPALKYVLFEQGNREYVLVGISIH